jgi:hypothetical protein
MSNRVPVHAVSGPAAARRAWLAALDGDSADLRLTGCPCCVGRVEMQVKLAQYVVAGSAVRVR